MKYGQIFRAQSAPQWAPYNVDYDELKNIIKVHTTKSQSQAIVIPGQEDVQFQKFEKLFYNELSNQHDRVDLFVKSKVDEINCRLQNLHRQILRLMAKCARDAERNENYSLRSRNKFAKYERQIERCGEEIRCLEKFIAAQRVAFHKILKKYTKWTSSRALAELFCDDILSNPKSFVRRDFNPLISQYMSLLRNVRAAVPDSDKLTSHDLVQQASEPILSKPKTNDQSQVTYWNEYDDGSEAEEEPYLVYIDPNSDVFPGAKALANMISKARRPVEKVRGWLTLAAAASSEEQRSLLDHKISRSCDQESAIDTEGGDVETYVSSSDLPNGYSTFYTTTILNINEPVINSKRENFILQTVFGCHAASLTLLLIAWLLATTGKKRLRMEVDAGVAIGVVASLLFATIGFFLTHFRRHKLSKSHRCCAFVTLIITFFLNGMLLIHMTGTI